MKFIDHWYKQSGAQGAEAAFKTLTKLFDKKMVSLSKVKKNTDIKDPDKLLSRFRSGSDAELTKIWRVFTSNIIQSRESPDSLGSLDSEKENIGRIKSMNTPRRKKLEVARGTLVS